GKTAASAALGVAIDLQGDLGVEGQSPNAYQELKVIEGYVKDLKSAASAIGSKQEAVGGMAQDFVSMVQDMMKQQAQALGLEETGLAVGDMAKQGAPDLEKINDKLDEIDAKIRALQEAMKVEDVVVKTWFESEE
ncbi:MAG: hypothetical protein GX606_00390, partial [Elusimicrobia bacterium]|nr:hypothetical protein [Elusimicrobiota bacterium]